VEAVIGELVSAFYFPVFREIQGNFAFKACGGDAPLAWASQFNALNPDSLTKGAGNSLSEQGIARSVTGKQKHVSRRRTLLRRRRNEQLRVQ
jgi:hypothetical protein